MAGIRGKDTQPELAIRRGLFALGYRYRLHDRRLPGRPDVVFASRKAAILIHGCFWHQHDCHLFKWPSTRREFWRDKIQANASRDGVSLKALHALGWRVMVVWECALKGRSKKPLDKVIRELADWLESPLTRGEIAGETNGRR